ncbi:FecR family protein [[Flexibacter] sp. ATCC 35208]|uniref:FecR family protein n=1 Tax=[Flexibacter] sp. ATCC 35208 TaxID=1936242 RepID=UPI0015C30C4B|nr:FecR family protein [[Flexibacter] sp. ATCC 35208]
MEAYIDGRLSGRALHRFLEALNEPLFQQILSDYLQSQLQEFRTDEVDNGFAEEHYQKFISLVRSGLITGEQESVIPMYKRPTGLRFWKIAAIVIGMLIGGLLWYQLVNKSPHTITPTVVTIPSVSDTIRQPYVAFADGSILILDSLAGQNDHLRQIGGTVDLKNRRLSLSGNIRRTGDGNLIHTLVTPRGTQYSVALADGSVIWLNAYSRLQFPSHFSEERRGVGLSGEGYFDVAESDKPFLVVVEKLTIAVVGTRFNVRAYNGERSVHTTLLRGKLKVEGDRQQHLLLPGQALLIEGARWRVLNGVDTSQVVAWRQQLFDFRKANLRSIMPELARWYEISYEIPPRFNRTFSGKISRSYDIATVLQILREGGIRCRQEGKKVVFYD